MAPQAPRFLATLVLALAAFAPGCGGDGVIQGVGPMPPVAESFQALQAAVFSPRCALPGCHTGGAPPQGLDLSDGHAYAHLVGVASTEQPSLMRVQPGKSADSYLVMKIAGDPRIAGERMPFGGPYLDLPTVDAIRRWVDAGAPNN